MSEKEVGEGSERSTLNLRPKKNVTMLFLLYCDHVYTIAITSEMLSKNSLLKLADIMNPASICE